MAIEQLASRLHSLCAATPFDTTWYLKDLRSGEEADRGGDTVVPSASTRKTSIMMTALKAVNDGRFGLADPVTIQAKYQKNTSGCFQHLEPGFVISFRDALVMMIIVSDNTCTGTVADLVGLDEINAYCQAIGMKSTLHRYGLPPQDLVQGIRAGTVTTARDQGLLLDLILAGTRDAAAAARLGCPPELVRLGLDILSWQKLNTRLPSLLPAGTVVAHKTGTGPRNFNDAGIVYSGAAPLFILTCYTGGVPLELADGTPGFAAAANLIGRLARTAYDALKP
ncbi:MAG: serine hydrolase [Bacillota bacterium]|nr:serine hydrolase [Bacillota bacterium]